MLAYDQLAFQKEAANPWDAKKRQGPRGLFSSTAKAKMQFAVIAAGVAHK